LRNGNIFDEFLESLKQALDTSGDVDIIVGSSGER
jgi:hypothetical protein